MPQLMGIFLILLSPAALVLLVLPDVLCTLLRPEMRSRT